MPFIHNYIIYIEGALAFLAGVLGLYAARLKWVLSTQGKAEQQHLRQWYDAKWCRIKDSPWLTLPEIVIAWLVRARDSLIKRDVTWVRELILVGCQPLVTVILWIHANQSHPPPFQHEIALITIALLLYGTSLIFAFASSRAIYVAFLFSLTVIGAYLLFFYRPDPGHRNAIIVSITCAWLVVLFCHWIKIYGNKFAKDVPRGIGMAMLLDYMLIGALFLYVQVVWFNILTVLSISWATVAALLLLPFTGVTIGFIPAWVVSTWVGAKKGVGISVITDPQTEGAGKTWLLFGFSIAFSFTITLSAMLVGHQVDPQAWVPQTERMLWSNALFDGATVVVSLYVLERALPPRSAFPIPTAVVLDLLLGILFACASLWFGVKQLTLTQVFRVLVAHSPDSRYWEFGPYFWAMHTVFLPLLFYLGVVVLCWVGKAVVARRERFYGKAKGEEFNGLTMTAAFLDYIVKGIGVLGLLIVFFAWIL